ncbi:uncharacterized protein LOC106667062 [Cimex lectularius]|uniref:CPR type cuticle protein n=1 Tax=Cimex lectularius TaxID=79782 RepID=A0A8I6RPN1_CIMLE|nr:uncharacterized protein LOC106667062 [Cimex lectularius]
MWIGLVVCGLLAGLLAQGESQGDVGSQVVPRYWRAIDGTVHKDSKVEDPDQGVVYPDKLQVISSSLRILPKRVRRQRRSEGSWRKPREYQFVTRDKERDSTASGTRSARLVDQSRASSNYYPQERAYYNRGEEYYNRRSGSPPNRRIIYYATLPEVVRRPGEWTPPRPIYNPSGYPTIRDNEITRVRSPVIDVTRVQSSVIDVSDKNRFDGSYPQDLSTPKFTIIDAEPPYNRPPPPVYESDRYDRGRFDSRYERPRYDHNRYDYNYNRHDYRNYVDPPYRYYDEPRLPPQRHQVLPPQPITVVRKPLDVRPLDPVRDLTTQAPPSSSTTTSSPSTSSTSNPISSFERTFKF